MPSARQPSLRVLARPGFTVRAMCGSHTLFASHTHAVYSVTTVVAGRLDLTLADRRLELHAGETALLNANEVHAATAREYAMCAVGLSPELMDELLSESGFAVSGAYGVFRSTAVHDPVLTDLASAITDELAESRPGQLTMVTSLVRQLGVHLLREHLLIRRAPSVELSRAGPVDRRLRLAIELMHESYDRDLDLEEIASAAYLSSFYFQRLFKRLMGVSPHEYLVSIRMEQARNLLLHGTSSINEVARAVGFRSQSHFARIFKEVNGVSPLAFRASSVTPSRDA